MAVTLSNAKTTLLNVAWNQMVSNNNPSPIINSNWQLKTPTVVNTTPLSVWHAPTIDPATGKFVEGSTSPFSTFSTTMLNGMLSQYKDLNPVNSINPLTLTGTDGADKLNGLVGNDTLIGGLGKDTLTGGTGADVFKFNSVKDSPALLKQADTITDFKHAQGDKIDLSAIDANSVLAGDQAFILISAATFSANATGQLRFDPKTSTLYGSTNADASPEFAIVLSGVKSLVAGDLVL